MQILKYFQERQKLTILLLFIVVGLIFSTFFKVEIIQRMSDALLYNDLAKEWLGIAETHHDKGVTSPLYPLFIALVIKIFGVDIYLPVLAKIHFIFLALSAFIFYIITLKTFKNKTMALVAGLFILLNPHFIMVAAQFMSETLGLFLACLYGLFLFRLVTREGKPAWNLMGLGIFSGLLVLCRFNLVLIPFVTVLIIGIEIIRSRDSLRIKIQKLFAWGSVFAVFTFLVLNFWALRNQGKYGEYSLFPASGRGSSRNAAMKILNEDTKISPEFQPIKDLILEINKPYAVDLKKREEGRQYLSKYWPESLYNFKYGEEGYQKYLWAENALYEYFGLEPVASNYYKLSSKISPFYRDIYEHNRQQFMQLRIYSAFYTLVPSEYKPLDKLKPNIPLLNNKIFQTAYVFLYAIIILFFSLASMIFLFSRIFKKWSSIENHHWLIIYIAGILVHFIFLHGYTIMMKDSNRFKYCFLPLFFYAALYLAIYYLKILKKPKKETI